MHGGLTGYPARWAGLRDAAPLALGGRPVTDCLVAQGGLGHAALWALWGGLATGSLASWVGLEHVAPLALWDRRETRNRQCRLSASQAGRDHTSRGDVEAYKPWGLLGQAQRARGHVSRMSVRYATPWALWFRPNGPSSLSPRHRLGSADIHNFMRPEGPR
jgi:hypothetical protein